MVYELKDLKRSIDAVKRAISDMDGVLFRMNINPDKEQSIMLNQARITLKSMKDTQSEFENFNLPNLNKVFSE